MWAQSTETKEETYTITKSKLEKYVADKVAKAVAEEREKAAHEKPVTDAQVLNRQNWHIAIFNKAEYVVYTGPGSFLFHHWVEPGELGAKPPAAKSGAAKGGAATTPPSKGG